MLALGCCSLSPVQKWGIITFSLKKSWSCNQRHRDLHQLLTQREGAGGGQSGKKKLGSCHKVIQEELLHGLLPLLTSELGSLIGEERATRYVLLEWLILCAKTARKQERNKSKMFGEKIQCECLHCEAALDQMQNS